MQTKYESEKKDRRIIEVELKNQQEKGKRIQQEKENLEKQKALNYVLISLFSLLIMLLIIIYAYRIKQRNNKLLTERNDAIEENLSQKETMIGEIHHRVKNNLQLITSILDLQARSLDNDEAKKAIHDSQNRVRTMAIIHQKLYQQDDIYGISMKEYITSISEAIIDSTTEKSKKINFVFNIFNFSWYSILSFWSLYRLRFSFPISWLIKFCSISCFWIEPCTVSTFSASTIFFIFW